MSRIDGLLEDQITYYRARAGEYNEIFEPTRVNPSHPLGPKGPVADTLRALAKDADVLDLACGTGYWSSILVETAASLTAVDAAEEMLRLHAEQVPDPRVRRLRADVLSWVPDRRHDIVFFGFWLSHVPDGALRRFFDVVKAALSPGGTVAFVDTSAGEARYEEPVEGLPAPAVRRRLHDGREFRIVKVFRSAEDVAEALAAIGFGARVESIGERFLFGTARRVEPSQFRARLISV
jgi:demethylmenaquinone methyltransferase/2-methoxy-6-polyprenyl-1,4-benzoquinol methylase